MKPAIAVITPNILTGLGFRTILEKVGPPAEIAVFDDFDDLIAGNPDRFFHYFAAMQLFLRHRTFFLERSQKTILLGRGIPSPLAPLRQIDICSGEERIIRDLLRLRSEAARADHALPRPDAAIRRTGEQLSPREAEVLTLIARWLLNKQIADRLGIGLTTV
ncbi:MAG: LuxR C-terminal-related transcriptional regulator, partial [Alistipes sp.]|nr:LuxR C-terminal-related transcriptional regulator [Alistipes sp.]